MQKTINELLEKSKKEKLDSEEILSLLKRFNISLDVLIVLLEEIKAEQILQKINEK